MKALVIRQPWAWAIAAGHKPVENRAIRTSYRGPLAIVAGAVDAQTCHMFRSAFRLDLPTELPRGIIAICDLVDCIPWPNVLSPLAAPLSPDQLRWFTGPYCWFFDNVRPLAASVPCRSLPGLFSLPASITRLADSRSPITPACTATPA
jgi:hypothetical protein